MRATNEKNKDKWKKKLKFMCGAFLKSEKKLKFEIKSVAYSRPHFGRIFADTLYKQQQTKVYSA